jgi:[ribosomal protein S5]-alanine N-acetyltransferase
MFPVRIEGRAVVLREFSGGDAESLSKVYGDPVATRHLSFEPKTPAEVEQIVASAIRLACEVTRVEYMLAVADPLDDELVGVGRLALGAHDSGQIGFALRPDQWGVGKGVEVVRLLQVLGFEKLGLHRIWGARSPINTASERTMLQAGMISEGTIRGHLFTRGAWRDSVVHSILEDEYTR